MSQPNEPKNIEGPGNALPPQPEPIQSQKPKKTLKDAMANAAYGLCLGPEDLAACEEFVRKQLNAQKQP